MNTTSFAQGQTRPQTIPSQTQANYASMVGSAVQGTTFAHVAASVPASAAPTFYSPTTSGSSVTSTQPSSSTLPLQAAPAASAPAANASSTVLGTSVVGPPGGMTPFQAGLAAPSSSLATSGQVATTPAPANPATNATTIRPIVQVLNISNLYTELLNAAGSQAVSGVAAIQAGPSGNQGGSSSPISPFRSNLPNVKIIDVWNHNLHAEMARIVMLVDTYKYIAMDTEFPGVVARPTATQRATTSYHYQMLKSNVDLLKVIQVGFFFCDEKGNYISESCCWQFNFSFRVNSDLYAPDSFRLLEEAGIRFALHEEKGIDVHDFGEQLMMSGIVLNPNVKWLTFHAGYDYGYLLKILTCAPLPDDEENFFNLISIFFPSLYDVKYMVRSCEDLKGGLQRVAAVLGIGRVGPQHQAGSDAILTAAAFFKLREKYFESQIDDYKYQGVIFGLGATSRSLIPVASVPNTDSTAVQATGNSNSVAVSNQAAAKFVK